MKPRKGTGKGLGGKSRSRWFDDEHEVRLWIRKQCPRFQQLTQVFKNVSVVYLY